MKKFILSLCIIFVSFISVSCKEDSITLNVYNWGEYIDEAVLDEFEKETGIKINYETYATNEDMYIKLSQPASTEYDVCIPSDYMIEKMIKEDMLYEIDYDNIPNFSNINDEFKSKDYDPSDKYSVPYMWGTVGILYNKTMVNEPVDSWNILWDEKYKDGILMLDSVRDSVGISLKKMGYSLNSTNIDELNKAKEDLISQKPLVLAYVVDEGRDKMIGGEAALFPIWSGEAVAAMAENPDLAYSIPKEGSNIWFDALVIPKTSKHKKEAEMFINFMCKPEISAKNSNYIGYSTPIYSALDMIDDEYKNNPAAYPELSSLSNCEVFIDPGEFINEYDKIWTEIKAE